MLSRSFQPVLTSSLAWPNVAFLNIAQPMLCAESVRYMLQIRGIIALAQEFGRRIHNGIPPAEREAFLASVKHTLASIDTILCEHSGSDNDLSQRSRDAVAYLRKLAATPPDRLPIPVSGPAIPQPLRIAGIVGGLDGCLKRLAQGEVETARREAIFNHLQRDASNIEDLCHKNGTFPGAMPRQSAQAFAMMKWLSVRANFDLYVQQVLAALPPFRQASAARWPGATLRTGVFFAPGRYVWNVKNCAHAHTWHIAAGFLNARPQDLEDLAQVAVLGNKASFDIQQRHRAFLNSDRYYRFFTELDMLLCEPLERPNIVEQAGQQAVNSQTSEANKR